jgi:uncharacterized protein (TIGR03435 family)
VIAKSGPKLEAMTAKQMISENEIKGIGKSGLIKESQPQRGVIEVEAYTMEGLAEILSSNPDLARKVIDKTGLTGRYNFSLQWTPIDPLNNNNDFSGPPIFTAVKEQLGLSLEPGKAMLDTLVIDSAEEPTAN